VTEKDKGKGALTYDNAIEDTDALITAKEGLPLVILTADCLSVFLYDPEHHVIGMVHAGWRSSRQDISTKAVEAMRENFKSNPASLRAGFGPSMRQCCFEAGEEFEAIFPQDLIKREGRLYLDLPGLNYRQLLKTGLKQENIFDPGLCTFCQADDFFSFRREADTSGRMLSVIMLKG
jgi:YfiH family protein